MMLALILPMLTAIVVSLLEVHLHGGPTSAVVKVFVFNIVFFYVAPVISVAIAGTFENDKGIEHDPPRLTAAILVVSVLFYFVRVGFHNFAELTFSHRWLVPLIGLAGMWAAIGFAASVLKDMKMGN